MEEKEGRREGSEAGFTGFIGFSGLGSCLNARRIWSSTPQIADWRGLHGLRGFWGFLFTVSFRQEGGVGNITGLRTQTKSLRYKLAVSSQQSVGEVT